MSVADGCTDDCSSDDADSLEEDAIVMQLELAVGGWKSSQRLDLGSCSSSPLECIG